jgi:hypothetical protein
MEALCKRLGFTENLNPYSEKECTSNKERALKRITKSKEHEDLIQEFMSIWVEAASNGKDLMGPLMADKAMRGALDEGVRGQFFTPDSVSQLLTAMTDEPKTGVWDGITEWVIEPSAGFGGIILMDWAMHREAFENDAPCNSRVYIAQELSNNTAKVCYLQMVLSHMTGYVDCMDTLSEERWHDRWFTPNYLMMLKATPEVMMWYQTAHRGSWSNICMKAITERTKFKLVGNPPFDKSLQHPFLLKITDWFGAVVPELLEEHTKKKSRIKLKIEGEPPTREEIVVTANTQWEELVAPIEAMGRHTQEESMFITEMNLKIPTEHGEDTQVRVEEGTELP